MSIHIPDELVNWYNWAYGEPNMNRVCVQMYQHTSPDEYMWKDALCAEAAAFVCEYGKLSMC